MSEPLQNQNEILPQPEQVAITTITFYPGWKAGAESSESLDQLRGNLALETLSAAKTHGYGVTVIDGGSSDEFKAAAKELGIDLDDQEDPGMSGARRQGISLSAEKPGVEVILMTEPEKVSLIDKLVPALARPILDGQADIVVPARTDASYETYPPFQVKSERYANDAYNRLMTSDDVSVPDLDMFMGPRLIRNDPELIALFMKKYDFDPTDVALHKNVKLEGWANTLFFPVMSAQEAGYRVASVPIDYEHPAEQTASEVDNEAFDAKRMMQARGILTGVIHYQKAKRGRPSRLSQHD